MTRSILTLAAAVVSATAFFAPAAQACISCEYTPEVVNTPVYSHGDYYERRSRVRAVVKVRHIRPEREFVAIEREPRKVEAKVEADPVDTTPVALKVNSENSSISTASVEKSEAPAVEKTASVEPKVSQSVGCKKFFPTVGMTLTVPCG
jgi:hypothetical protein